MAKRRGFTEHVEDKANLSRYMTRYIVREWYGKCVECGHEWDEHTEFIIGYPCLCCVCPAFIPLDRPSAVIGVMM